MKLMIVSTALLVAAVAYAEAPEPPFIATAIQGDIAETMMGELAQKQGATPGVRSYGAMLAKDHAAHRKTAEGLARSMKVAVPTQPSAEQVAAYNDLKAKTGKDFDTAFVDHMIMDHDKDINAYQKQYAEGKGAMPRLAIKTLPVLKKHLAMAQGLKTS